ncbi:MAG: DUF5686 and carboxypeptidase regulatory-like domain-containing protein [Bacteroidetes bacterium]|nr:DUF5686 and carboxypeptidase regulatory-like domain-containing protein [Bacteroidota bacterium]
MSDSFLYKTLTACFLFFFILSNQAITAVVSGKVTDEKGQPLPYANVYIKGTSIGTATNMQGEYQLKLEDGEFEMLFQYIGFKKHSEMITIKGKAVHLNVRLIPEEITLAEVTISAEDPSYPIIRKAIARKDHYRTQVESYSCRVFTKSIFRMTDAPDKMFGQKVFDKEDSLKGIFYLSESESKISFRQPSSVKEVMISSKISGENKGYSINYYSVFMLSFYNNLVSPPLNNGRGFVGPLSDNAFFYYRYKLEGSFNDGKSKVYKIRVIPKRSNDPVYSGYIYIVDNDYRIHSLDLNLPREAKINFIDSMKISQQYIPINDTCWMILSQKIHFFFSIDFLGKKFAGNGIFHSHNADYQLLPGFSKDYFTNEYIRIEPTANTRDSAYWAAHRSIPLTKEEEKTYRSKDSLLIIHNSRPYLDSVQRHQNRLQWNIIWSGYTRHLNSDSLSHSYSSPISSFQFNTVTGWNVRTRYTLNKTSARRRDFMFTSTIEYGFSDLHPRGEAGATFLYDPDNFASIHLKAGFHTLRQFDPASPINNYINSLYSILAEENFMKVYEKSFLQLIHISDICNGLTLSEDVDFSYSSPLINHVSSPVTDIKGRNFSSNHPLDPENQGFSFDSHKTLEVSIMADYVIAQRYGFLPYKTKFGSKYPTIGLQFTSGYYLENKKTGYNYLEISLSHSKRLGLLGQIYYQLKGGVFLDRSPEYFIDYRHFSGNRTLITDRYMGSFRLLDYYKYSTGKSFGDFQAEQHFNGWIFNKLPLLKKTKLHEVAGVHYLTNDRINNYWEINFGIENIFSIFRVDYVKSFDGSKAIRDGIVITIPFSQQ